MRHQHQRSHNHRRNRSQQYCTRGNILGPPDEWMMLPGHRIAEQFDRGIKRLGDQHQCHGKHQPEPFRRGDFERPAQSDYHQRGQPVNSRMTLRGKEQADSTSGIAKGMRPGAPRGRRAQFHEKPVSEG